MKADAPAGTSGIGHRSRVYCRWCQRETGTTHALDAVYEARRVVHTGAGDH